MSEADIRLLATLGVCPDCAARFDEQEYGDCLHKWHEVRNRIRAEVHLT